MRNENPTVYSSEHGRHCSKCGRPLTQCTCKTAAQPQGDGVARIRRETKGRGGKTVTTITGLPLSGEALRTLLSDLKRQCGTGGALKDGIIEIQGDHRDVILAELKKRGLAVKLAGG